jgi:stage II sporulation protein D (peptidoglycan lytic transglycosylase)
MFVYVRMKTRLLRIAAAVPLALLAACASTHGPARPGRSPGREPDIRVLVLSTSASATIAMTSAHRAVAADGSNLFSSDHGGTLTVQPAGDEIEIRRDLDTDPVSAGTEVTFEPAASGAFSVGGVWYPGSIRARLTGDGTLELINVVGVESYLEGVVPYEIGDPGADAYAAIEAQAVAARTYALSRMAMYAAREYDVEAGVADQVYRGNAKQTRLADAAVRDTRGEVLRYHGQLCDAYYSATCGGHTSDIRVVWPDRPSAPYLYGARDCIGGSGDAFCSGARNFRWRYSFTGRELGATLRRTLPALLGVASSAVGDLVDVRIRGRSPSGRVEHLDVVTSTGTFTVDGDRIRRAVMLDVAQGRILPSTMFDVEKKMDGDRLAWASFVGGGNGHGVGMCQNGAIAMAKQGYSYTMILQHYYPGTTTEPGY